MGSSADSCDSETTVTSFGEDLVTPTAQDQPCFNESEEESLRALRWKEKERQQQLLRQGQMWDSLQRQTVENMRTSAVHLECRGSRY